MTETKAKHTPDLELRRVFRKAPLSAEFEISTPDGWCRFSVNDVGQDVLRVGSFGGKLWPSSFPTHFEHVGPDKAITSRSGPELNANGLAAVRAAIAKAEGR